MERINTGCTRRKGFLRPLLEFQADCTFFVVFFFPFPDPLTCQNVSINCSKKIKAVLALQKGIFMLKHCLLVHGIVEGCFRKYYSVFFFFFF